MTLVLFEPGFPAGSPDRVTLQVRAIGSTDAIDQAKAEARSMGYRVKTLGRVSVAAGQEYVDQRLEQLDWNVELVVRPAA